MSNGGVDKEALYGNYLAGQRDDARYQRQRRRFGLKLAHKAVDERFDEDEDMQVNANRYGVGPLGLIGAMLAASVPSAAILAWALNRESEPVAPPPPTTTPPAVEQPAGTDTFNRIKPLPGE